MFFSLAWQKDSKSIGSWWFIGSYSIQHSQHSCPDRTGYGGGIGCHGNQCGGWLRLVGAVAVLHRGHGFLDIASCGEKSSSECLKLCQSSSILNKIPLLFLAFNINSMTNSQRYWFGCFFSVASMGGSWIRRKIPRNHTSRTCAALSWEIHGKSQDWMLIPGFGESLESPCGA